MLLSVSVKDSFSSITALPDLELTVFLMNNFSSKLSPQSKSSSSSSSISSSSSKVLTPFKGRYPPNFNLELIVLGRLWLDMDGILLLTSYWNKCKL
ncbi:hypothetical protein WICPIJ_009947 [Wickerhamomyces pijperi]|uniref:Uncharacterized protein n=1 Tax=Wickerhamomyces pijperi TaxID=599730 RepID=A0A9P8PJY2_WICPI|nr:hypothetical protein WICPIJ_009947 [Wickerhamomyces pijperi]